MNGRGGSMDCVFCTYSFMNADGSRFICYHQVRRGTCALSEDVPNAEGTSTKEKTQRVSGIIVSNAGKSMEWGLLLVSASSPCSSWETCRKLPYQHSALSASTSSRQRGLAPLARTEVGIADFRTQCSVHRVEGGEMQVCKVTPEDMKFTLLLIAIAILGFLLGSLIPLFLQSAEVYWIPENCDCFDSLQD